MAQIRQPKIHVSNYKLARKTSVGAILQKLKPYINARCAEYFAENLAENYVYQGGALLLNHLEKKEPLIAGHIDPVKNLWQGRNVHGSRPPGLTMLGDPIVKDTVMGDNHNDTTTDNVNQGRAQASNAADDFRKIYPIWYKIGQLQTANLNDRVQHLFIATKFKLPTPQCVVIRPPPRRGRRIEIDLTAFEKIFDGSVNVLALNAIFQSNRKAKSTPVPIEKPEVSWLEQLEGVHNVWCAQMLNNIVEAPMKLKPQAHSWLRTNEEFVKVLTYLVVICILGFIFTLLI